MNHCGRSNVSPWADFMFPEFEELLVDDAMFDALIGGEPIPMTGLDVSSETAIPSRFTELDDEVIVPNEPQTAPSALPLPHDLTTDAEIQPVEIATRNENTALGPRRYFSFGRH
jgi:hypothetical protein